MIYGLKGSIEKITANYIVINVRDVYYEVIVTHPEDYSLNETTIVYTYQVVREQEQYLVGFSSLDEKHAFLDLIKVAGIGPKTALNILSATTPTLFYNAVATKDVRYLKSLPGIGPKAAQQILLDIKGQVQVEKQASGKSLNPTVLEALKSIGFKAKEANKAIESVYEPGLDDDELLKRALVALRK